MEKEWWKSKTIWTSGAAFVVAVLTAMGFIDTDMGLKIEGGLLPVVLAFLRIGDKSLV